MSVATRASSHRRPPKSLPGLDTIAHIARWAQAAPSPCVPRTWRVMEDTDGSVILIPPFDPEPAFAIMPRNREFEVLVCDPEQIEELGPFATMQAALAGIAWWLNLPCRSVELHDGGDVGGDCCD